METTRDHVENFKNYDLGMTEEGDVILHTDSGGRGETYSVPFLSLLQDLDGEERADLFSRMLRVREAIDSNFERLN